MKKPAPKHVYDPPEDRDGTRILVDRLWPRGIPRERAKVDLWLKDIAPSHALRKRFHGKPDDWDEFRAAYFAELESEAGRAAAEELPVICGRARSPCSTRRGTSNTTTPSL